MTTVSIDELQTGAQMFADVYAAFAAGLKNISADQAVVLDALTIASFVDPALAPLVIVEPEAEKLLAYVIANNTQGTPGSQTPIISGKKGSDPWET